MYPVQEYVYTGVLFTKVVQYLANGEVEAKEVELQADARGLSKRTLERAKDALSVQSDKRGKKWFWSLDKTSHE